MVSLVFFLPFFPFFPPFFVFFFSFQFLRIKLDCTIGEVGVMDLTAKVVPEDAGEGSRPFAARPVTGRVSLLAVVGATGKF